MINDETAWQAVQNRDRNYDGSFVTGVLSTGIYCRPSCAAKHPKRENVRFFETNELAQAQGLRACKRCLPDDVQRDEAAIKIVIHAFEEAESTPKLSELSSLTGYSPSHLQRIFKRSIGVSPAVYGRALRSEKVRNALAKGISVTKALYEAGYNGASTFYAEKGKYDQMSVSVWKNGGAGSVIHWAIAHTSLGNMLVAATDKGICRLSFNEDKDALIKKFPKAQLEEGDSSFAELFDQVVLVVESGKNYNDIPLDVAGTAFQEAVWDELRRIPAGETRSYAEIAAAVGKPKAVRATGSANGANNVAVLIPCHRVVRSDGALGGYAYGIEIKEKLLKKESIQ